MRDLALTLALLLLVCLSAVAADGGGDAVVSERPADQDETPPVPRSA